MSNDGERRQVKQVRSESVRARAGGGVRERPLLPASNAPDIVSAARLNAAALDTLFAIVPHPPSAAALRRLPESARWRELDAQSPARAGSVRTTVLANRRHTLAVLGYLASDASAFERLSLAGRMLKEAAARAPQVIGLVAAGPAGAARAGLEATRPMTCGARAAASFSMRPASESRSKALASLAR